MSILKATDFNDANGGEFALAINDFTGLASFIATYEKKYLLKLLGAELYALFIGDLTAGSGQIPQQAKYLTIFNEIIEEINDESFHSEGIKQMLKCFIYFHYMRESAYQKTISGVARAQGENNFNLGYTGFNLVESYNKGVEISQAIQWYMIENAADYPEFNGTMLMPISGI